MYSHLKNIYNLLERIDPQYQDYVLLTESQESKSISAAKKLVMQKFGWDEQRADKFVREELRHDFSVLHHNSKAGKFILGLTRMFCDNQLRDGGIIQRLNSTLELVASDAHINEYDRNLNGMSAQELIDRFSGARKEIGDKDREEVGALELQENNDYTIVQIDDFEQSEKYGQYTSWCVTHSPSMLDSYTSGGIGQFYFCLKNGFENVPQKQGEGCPLDEYGLSMVAVSVDEDGALNTCTCRWNHDCGGNDNIMDTKQISQLIGKNFYEVFKPNNKWKTALDDVMQRLANGENPETLFDDYNTGYDEDGTLARVKLKGKYNFFNVKTKQIISNKWFDWCSSFQGGFSKIIRDNLYYFIREDGTLVSNVGFDDVDVWKNGLCIVKSYSNGGKENILKSDGNLLLNNWADAITYLYKNYYIIATLKNNRRKYNIVNSNGQFILDEWVYRIQQNDNPFMVSNIVATYNTRSDSPGGLYVNFFNLDTLSYISDEWFNQVIKNFGESYSYGAINGRNRAIVGKIKENDSNRIEYEENILDLNGNLICSNWYDKIEFKEKKYGIVLKNELKNIIFDDNDIIGLISPDLWFNEIYTYNGRIFCDGWASVRIGKGPSCFNFINPDGKFLLKKGVDYAHPFSEGFAKIRKNKKFNLLRTDGSLLSPNLWFDDITPVSTVDEEKVYACVKNDDKFNFISKNGQLLTDVWFDKVGTYAFFQTDYTVCRLGHESYILYLDGTLKKVKDELGENTIRKIVSETVRYLLAEMDR